MILKVKRHYEIEHFNKFSLLMKLDSVASAFNFQFYFNPDSQEHRLLFQPGHYHIVDVEHNGELLCRGFILNQDFGQTSLKQLSGITGSSLCGVIETSNIPTSLYPLQFDNQSLREIANKVVSVFPKFNAQFDSVISKKAGENYEKVTANETQTIKNFLGGLASQKDIILSQTPEGNLLFTKAKTKQSPIYNFTQGIPGTEMTLSFRGQQMHSHIEVIKQADIDGGNAGETLIKNPFVPYVYRPLVKTQNTGNDIDTEEAARNTLASQLKNIVLTIRTNVWEIDGKVIKPNNIITVKNEELYLYKTSRWLIESVLLEGDEKQTVATLTCVLPEVYNGETPKYIFEQPTEEDH